jgi:aldose 1-epimerase
MPYLYDNQPIKNVICNQLNMKFISEEAFKTVHQGKQTGLYTLKNKNGLVAQITNYGAIIVSLYVPDRNGKLADIVQGL